MTHLHGLDPAWVDQLPKWRDHLVLGAREKPGEWMWRELPIGWRFSVILTEGGQMAYRFRSPQYAGVAWHDFRTEAHRLMKLLGAGEWRERVNVRKLFWEIEFIAPADPPATPKGDA